MGLRSEGVGIGDDGAGEGRMGFGTGGAGSGISFRSSIGGRNPEPYGFD